MTPHDDIVELPGGWLLIGGQATVDAHRAMRAALGVTSGRDHIRVHARVRRLDEALARQANEVVRSSAVARAEHEASASCLLSTAEVAVLIGRHERTVTRRAAQLGGRLSGRGWLFDEATVMAWLDDRGMSACPLSDVRGDGTSAECRP